MKIGKSTAECDGVLHSDVEINCEFEKNKRKVCLKLESVGESQERQTKKLSKYGLKLKTFEQKEDERKEKQFAVVQSPKCFTTDAFSSH